MLLTSRLVFATTAVIFASSQAAASPVLTITQFTASVEVVGSPGFPTAQQSTTTFGETISVAGAVPPPDITEGSASTTTGVLGNGFSIETRNYARTEFRPEHAAFVGTSSLAELRFSVSESTTLVLDGWIDTDFYLATSAAGPFIRLYQEGSPDLLYIDPLRLDEPISESLEIEAGDYVLFLSVFANSSFGGTGSAPGERTGGCRLDVTVVPAPWTVVLLLGGGMTLSSRRARPCSRAMTPARS